MPARPRRGTRRGPHCGPLPLGLPPPSSTLSSGLGSSEWPLGGSVGIGSAPAAAAAAAAADLAAASVAASSSARSAAMASV